MSFSSLGLSEVLVDAVHAAGYQQPTPVQQQAIPAVLDGDDLMVAAQTGTGKTGSFALPILEQLFPQGDTSAKLPYQPKQTRVLVLTPTRELAAQVHDSFQLYAQGFPLRSACIFGGVGQTPQIKALAKGVDVLVACPGRLLDLLGQDKVDLSCITTLVLDEADRMLDMGFIHDVKKVLARLPAKRQNLLFSATFSNDIVGLANQLLHRPRRIQITPPNTTVERIEQRVYRIASAQKRELLAHLITTGAWEQVLVFTRTKHGANRLADYLNKHGLPAAAIHGNKSQNARTKALSDFKTNEIRILVATDIAARGLDIDQLPHVVNYDLPNVEEDYVHRIGRTGRAGRTGEAISLVSPDEEKLLKSIEKMTKQHILEGTVSGFDPEQSITVTDTATTVTASTDETTHRFPVRGLRRRRKKTFEDSDKAEKTTGERRSLKTHLRRDKRDDKNPVAVQHPASPAKAKVTRNHSGKPAAIADPNRDPEEFLDDDYDNFGNRADYVSPYEKAKSQAGSRKPQRTTATTATRNTQNGQAKAKPANGAVNGPKPKKTAASTKPRKPRKPSGSRATASRMNDAPLREPTEYSVAKPTRQPLVINKKDLPRRDRLPTLEQLDELKSKRQVERPALLTRSQNEG